MSRHHRTRYKNTGPHQQDRQLLSPLTWQRVRAGEFLHRMLSPWSIQLLGLLALLALAGGIAAVGLRN